MGGILSFFLAGPAAPARLQVLLAGVAAAVIAGLGLLVWGLYWRGEYREAKASVAVLEAQVRIDAAALTSCSTATEEARRVGAAAIGQMAGLVTRAEAANASRKSEAASLEQLAAQARKPGEDCGWAWQQIEQQHRKARGTP